MRGHGVQPEIPVTEEQGQLLLKLARSTLEQRLGLRESVDRTGLTDPALNAKGATFVTLKCNTVLRGCIGNLEAEGSIVSSVERNALSAAFHDHRFDPLRVEELETVAIEISILSTPRQIDYQDGDDLIAQLTPFVDGVVLRQGSKGATFLPQVWSQLPVPETFLENLCQKAGLPPQAWREVNPDIYIYHVRSFKEKGR